MNYEIFQSCWWEWALVLSLVSTWVLFSLSFSLVCWILEKDLCNFPDVIVQFSSLWDSILWRLAIQVSLDSQFHLLNPIGQWSSAQIGPLCTAARNFFKVWLLWFQAIIGYTCFVSSLVDHYPLLPNSQCLEMVVLCVLSLIVVRVCKVNLMSIYFGWKQNFP